FLNSAQCVLSSGISLSISKFNSFSGISQHVGQLPEHPAPNWSCRRRHSSFDYSANIHRTRSNLAFLNSAQCVLSSGITLSISKFNSFSGISQLVVQLPEHPSPNWI